MNYHQQINLFHLLIIVPILLVVGLRIVRKEPVTEIEGVLLLLLGAIGGARHLQLFFMKK